VPRLRFKGCGFCDEFLSPGLTTDFSRGSDFRSDIRPANNLPTSVLRIHSRLLRMRAEILAFCFAGAYDFHH